MEKVFSLLAALFSIIFLMLGLVGIIQPESSVFKSTNIPIDVAIQCFILSFIAAIIPFVKEISFFGYGIKLLDKIRKANERIDNLESIINLQKNKSREYLIDIFLKYIKSLNEEDEKNEKLIELNKIYFQELDVDIVSVKKSLNKWIKNRKDKKIPLFKDLSDTIDIEFINTLKVFQEDMKLKNAHGVFGYFTCEKLKEYMD